MCEANDDMQERRFFDYESLIMEKVRLGTFCDWQVDYIKPRDLARSMLVSERNEDRTCCFSCHVIYRGFARGDVPWNKHQRECPDCAFIKEPEIHGNVPIVDDDYIPYEQLNRGLGAAAPPNPEEEEQMKKAFKFINDYHDFLITRTLPKPPRHILRTEAIKKLVVRRAVYPTYMDAETRKFSFRFWPREIDINTDDMVKAGFFSLRIADLVQCYVCGGGLYGWKSGEDPNVVHARFYSFCPYVNSKIGEETVAKIAAENPPPLAPDRSVNLTEEESKLLLSLPVCKKAFELKMNWDLIETVCRVKIEESGFPFKNWRIFLDKIGEHLEDIELMEIRERQKKPEDEKEPEVDYFKSLEADVMEKEGLSSLEEVKKV
ncbi:E3 ubiquitin-protein ligase XIAP-like [Palaemon carinicauda]|uniref:E3 ubiquitin-protein ligase XIAP-like n=1 Tax=Palaemon carinicauda TaxID=392227 RepID=UPI0035B61E47